MAVSQELYNAFRSWAIKKYGSWAVLSQSKFTFNEFQKSPEYQEWIKTPEYAAITAQEKEQATIGFLERKPPFYQKDYPTVDTLPPIDPTVEWVLTTSDPTTGRVLSNPEWKTQKKTVPPPVGGLTIEEEKQIALTGAGLAPTWYEEQQLALEREKFGWTKEQTGLAKIKEQFDLERQFEEDRNRMMQGIPSNDWIRRYVLQNEPNPYKEARLKREWEEKQTATGVAFSGLTNKLDSQTAAVQFWDRMVNQAAATNNTTAITVANEKLKEAKATRDETYDIWKSSKTEEENWTPQGVPQIFPNTPEWLPYYVPGVTAGRMITPQSVPTPSGQQLTAMPTSQLESLASYSKWAGGQMWRPLSEEVRKITESAALMQPETPFNRTRWSPAGARI